MPKHLLPIVGEQALLVQTIERVLPMVPAERVLIITNRQQASAIRALCPALLFWISRVLMLSHRGRMHDDPVVFALSDRVSLGVGAFGALVLLVGAV